MGLLDRIKNFFRRKDTKLLDDGNRETKKNQNNKFKETIQDYSDENLSPEQWQIRFLEQNNCSEYIKNQFILNYLTSIPELASIKDKESFQKAQDYNLHMIKSLRPPNKTRINSVVFFKRGEKNLCLELKNKKRTDSFYEIAVSTKNTDVEMLKNGFELDYKETRRYDTNSGIEIWRTKQEVKNGNRTGDIYQRESLGSVSQYHYSDNSGIKSAQKKYYDLTTGDDDIATLNGVNNCEEYIKESSPEIQKAYEERLMHKIQKSSNPNACKEYAGISIEEKTK